MKNVIGLIKYLFQNPESYARDIGVHIGNGCYISTKNFSSEPYLIHIGDNVRVAKGVSFFTHGGIWPFRKSNENLDYFGKIVIGNNCYLGEDSKIMPGVTIEDNCIIGAGTVVTKSIPSGSIVAGNPVRYIGETTDFLQKVRKYNCRTKFLGEKDKMKLLLRLSEKDFVKKDFLIKNTRNNN